MPDDTVTLLVDGRRLAGWQAIRVTRGVERVPSDFDLVVTERYPGADAVAVEAGAPCELWIGADRVITGYVDREAASFDAAEHVVRVTGRSKCQDLVDCAADLLNNQLSAQSALALAQRLAAPYGVTVTALDGDGPLIPQFNVILGETAFEIIERVARFSSLLAYDGTDGNLILAQVGKRSAASGVAEGMNVERASVVRSMDQRYSHYQVLLMSNAPLQDVPAAGAGNANFNEWTTVTDDAVWHPRPDRTRYRKMVLIAEQTQGDPDLPRRRAEWEKARRYGRSQAVSVTVDSWRDAAGNLWEPNTLVPIQLPTLKLPAVSWVIAEVTYLLSAEGTAAQLLLMPPEAFMPQPTILVPFDMQMYREINPPSTNPRLGEGPGA